MSSQRRIESSRLNGALSRGPVTPEGKRRSSRNAEIHGLYSNNVLLNGESHELYEQIRQLYLTRYQPADPTEEHLVNHLVATHWRMNRIVVMEAASLDHEMDCQRPEIEETFESIDPSTRAALAFEALTNTTSSLATYCRFETTLTRQFDRLTRNLETRLAKKQKCSNEPNPKNEHQTNLTQE